MNQRENSLLIITKIKRNNPLFLLFLLINLFLGCTQNKQFQGVSAQNNSNKPTEELRQMNSPGKNDNTSISGIKDAVKNGLIIPGKSMGQLSLGNTREDAISYLGEPTEEYLFSDDMSCGKKEIHWNDYTMDNRGVFVYVRDNKIYHIESFTKRFRTPDNIKPDDLPKDLIRIYKNLMAYELLNSGSIVDGGKNIIYWIDEEQGIAFGIYYYPKKKQRMIGSIIIYSPLEKFQPNGCFSPLQEFVSRPKWYLD